MINYGAVSDTPLSFGSIFKIQGAALFAQLIGFSYIPAFSLQHDLNISVSMTPGLSDTQTNPLGSYCDRDLERPSIAHLLLQ